MNELLKNIHLISNTSQLLTFLRIETLAKESEEDQQNKIQELENQFLLFSKKATLYLYNKINNPTLNQSLDLKDILKSKQIIEAEEFNVNATFLAKTENNLDSLLEFFRNIDDYSFQFDPADQILKEIRQEIFAMKYRLFS